MHAWQGNHNSITPITVSPLRTDRLGTQYKFTLYQKQKTVGKKRSPGQNMEKNRKVTPLESFQVCVLVSHFTGSGQSFVELHGCSAIILAKKNGIKIGGHVALLSDPSGYLLIILSYTVYVPRPQLTMTCVNGTTELK